MTALMLGAVAAGIAPMPKPIPAALVAHTLGALPMAGLLALGLLAHFGYGGGAAAVLAVLTRKVTFWGAIAYAVLLWAIMGVAWLPYLGWGVFGTAQAPPIAVATLVLHLVYGATLGALFTWRQPTEPRTATKPTHVHH